MPGESKHKEHMQYLCFDDTEIFNWNEFSKLSNDKVFQSQKNHSGWRKQHMRKLTVEQRFRIAADYQKILHKNNTVEFILGKKYCTSRTATAVDINKEYIEAVIKIESSIGNTLPHFDNRRMKVVQKRTKEDRIRNFKQTFFTYIIDKLSWPYTDNCLDYKHINYADRLDALTTCQNDIAISEFNALSPHRWILRNSYEYYNYTVTYDSKTGTYRDICSARYPHVDCHNRVFLTDLEVFEPLPLKHNVISISIGNVDPSFTINSKPRIDHIDYVTFILGTLGTWLGFSFIILNPVPYFMSVQSIDQNNNSDMVTILINENSRMKNRISTIEIKYGSRFNKLESIITKLREKCNDS